MERAKVVAEAQEYFDYRTSNGVRVPEYEEKLLMDEETGQEYIKKVPKLILPEIEFPTLNLRDEQTERAFMQELKNAGVPVSDQAMMINVPIDFKDEVERIKEEKVQKIVADSQAQEAAVKAIMAQGLPLSPSYNSLDSKCRQRDKGIPPNRHQQTCRVPLPCRGWKNHGPHPDSKTASNRASKTVILPHSEGKIRSRGRGQNGNSPGVDNSRPGRRWSQAREVQNNPLRQADPNSPEGQMLQSQQATMLTEFQDRK